MPRHPPFALRNLTTKIKIAIRHHPQHEHQRCPVDWMTRIKDARVHCVVLNIRSAPHSPPSNDSASCGPTKDLNGPTPTRHSHVSRKPGPSGPNNVHQPAAPPQPVPTLQAERTEVGSITPNCTVNVPPMSYPSDTFGPNQAPGPACPDKGQHEARCSLERR